MSDVPEASERALRSLQDEGSGSSRTPLLNAKIERSLSPPLRPSSPDQTCAICLGEITDKSVTDSCFHRFCFSCLSEWSKVKPECPLCKARFTAIYHGIKSMNDFQVYRLDHSRNLPQGLDSLDAAAAAAAALDPHIFINVAVQRAFTGRFGYRTTMGLNPSRTRGPGGYIWGPPGGHDVIGPVPVSLPHPPSSRPVRVSIPNFASESSATSSSSSSRRAASRHQGVEFRKNVYRQNLWARPIDQNRIRESSPEFYRANLAQTHRLVPWLARELGALSDICAGFRFEPACRDILQWIRNHPINSAEFKRNLTQYLGAHTDHFVHEFYHFAISPYDMLGYDMQTRYTPSTAEQAVTQNGSDEDMEIDHDLPLLPFNLSVHDPIVPLRACIGPIGRPTRNISGRPRGLSGHSLANFDLHSYLFSPPVHSSVPEPAAASPEVIVLSSSDENEANESADSDSEVQIIGSLPPLHLRPPEHVIDLDDSNDSDVIEIKLPSPPLIEIDDDNDDDLSPQSPAAPSTSNDVAGPSGLQPANEGHLTRSSARFFRPSYREYSSSSDDELLSPKKKSSKKKAGGSKKTTRASKRSHTPKSSKFVETSSESDDSAEDKKDVKDRRASRKGPLEEARKRRKPRDRSASHSSRHEQDSEGSRVSKRNSSLPSKILASKNSRKPKLDDCNKCGKKRRGCNDPDPVPTGVSSPERSRTKQQKRKRKKNRSVSSDDDSSPPRRRKKTKGRRDSPSLSTASQELDSPPSQSSSSSGFNENSYVGGSNLARNPKAMSKKAMILRKREAETSSPDAPPAYRYGEMVELKSPTYYSMVLDNKDYPERAKDSFGTAEDSDSRSSTTLSMGTESAPPRHFEGLQESLIPSFSPLLSYSSFASNGRAVANGSPPRSNDLNLQPPSSSYPQSKLTKSESIPSGPPSIASPSSDSSSSRSTANSPAPLSNNSWPELSASQPLPDGQNQPETQPPSSPPNLRRFDDSPIITLEHSPLMSPPDYSSSWNSSSESPSTSPPRLKSIVTRVSSPPRSPSPLVSPHTNSDISTSDED